MNRNAKKEVNRRSLNPRRESLEENVEYKKAHQGKFKTVLRDVVNLVARKWKGKAVKKEDQDDAQIKDVNLDINDNEELGKLRGTFKQLKNIDHKHMEFLEQIGFFQDIRDEYPELFVSVDIKNRHLLLSGNSEQVKRVLETYHTTKRGMTERNLDLGEQSILWKVIKSDHWQNHFLEELVKNNIKGRASVNHDNQSVTVLASSSTECDKVIRCICESVSKQEVHFQEDEAALFQSEKLQKLFSKLKADNILEIRIEEERSLIELIGAPESVSQAEKEILQFIEVEKTQKESHSIPDDNGPLLSSILSSDVKDIEEQLKEYSVAITISPDAKHVQIKGTKEGLAKCKERLSALYKSIVRKDVKVSSPGLREFLEEKQEYLRMIETEKKVRITTISPATTTQSAQQPPPLFGPPPPPPLQGPPSPSPLLGPPSPSPLLGPPSPPPLLGPRSPPPPAPRTLPQTLKTTPPQTTPALPLVRANSGFPAICFGRVRVFLYHGDITTHKSDAIVNVLPKDLKLSSGGGVSKSILKVGGETIQNELDARRNFPPGSVVVTNSGSMDNIKKIIHFLPSSTKVHDLQMSIQQCFNEAKQQTLHSVSIPAIGTANYNIKPNESADFILEAANNFSTVNYPLDIHIVVFLKNMVPTFESILQEKAKKKLTAPTVAASTMTKAATTAAATTTTTTAAKTTATATTTTASMGVTDDPLPVPRPFILPLVRANSGSPAICFGLVRIFLYHGDITTHKSDAIVNVLPKDLKLSSGGGVCKSILKAGGQTIQNELDARSNCPAGSVVVTNSGSMDNVKKIIHFLPSSTKVHDLQISTEQCFNEAEQQTLHSVSIPAIGTANFNIKPNESADFILEAAKNFSTVNYPLDIHIVVFLKNMVPMFESILQEKAKKKLTAPAVAASTMTRTAKTAAATTTTTTTTTTAATVATTTTAVSRPESVLPGMRPLFSQRAKAVATARATTTATTATTLATTTTAVSRRKRYTRRSRSTRYDLELLVPDTIPLFSQRAKASPPASVATAKATTTAAAATTVATTTTAGSRPESLLPGRRPLYPQCPITNTSKKMLSIGDANGAILLRFIGSSEEAVDATVKKVESFIDENKLQTKIMNDNAYNVILSHQPEVEQLSRKFHVLIKTSSCEGEVSIEGMGASVSECKYELSRLTLSSEISVPQHWSDQPSTEVVRLVTLQTSSQEYQQVLNLFTNRGGTANKIVRIQRIQNPGLYRAYVVKKESMKGAENEKQLFHGTAGATTIAINVNNFSRSYAGFNATAYGKGVYFARDASYSLRYASPGANGNRYMYVARVLVGRYTIGQEDMKAPPSRNDPNNPGILFDSLVDNTINPSIFVIFQDHQCYPEYLITFR